MRKTRSISENMFNLKQLFLDGMPEHIEKDRNNYCFCMSCSMNSISIWLLFFFCFAYCVKVLFCMYLWKNTYDEFWCFYFINYSANQSICIKLSVGKSTILNVISHFLSFIYSFNIFFVNHTKHYRDFFINEIYIWFIKANDNKTVFHSYRNTFM